MRKLFRFVVPAAFLTLLNIPALSGAGFDSGGVSIDFTGDIPLRQNKAAGANLVKNGDFSAPGTDLAGEGRTTAERAGQVWDGCVYVHMSKSDGNFSDKLKLLRQKGVRQVETGAALIRTPLEITRDWKQKIRISNRVRQEVAIERSDRPTHYQLSFRMRGKSGNVPGWNYPIVFLFAGANPPRKGWKAVPGGVLQQQLPFTSAWQEYRINYTAPPGTATIKIDFALYGTGELQFDDVSLVKRRLSDTVGVRLIPFFYFDRLYKIGEKLPGNLLFAFGSESAPDRKNLRFMLELPAGFSVISQRPVHPLLSSRKLASGATEYAFDLSRLSQAAFHKGFRHWQAAAVLIESALPASAKKFPAAYWVENNRVKGEKQHFDLQVVPAVKSKRPRHFISSGMFSKDFNFTGPGIGRAGELYASAGFNSAHGGSGLWAKELKKRGINRYHQIYYIRNGFHIIPPPVPEAAKFRKIDGSAWSGASCPTAVYTRSPAYREKLLPLLEKHLGPGGDSDFIMCNWEPYMFDFRGCFCPRCKEEFRRYSGLAKKEVDAVWPKQVAIKYKDLWTRFRSWQHGRVVATLEADVRTIGKKAGKESHFIPEVAWVAATPNGRGPFAQYDVLDYVNDLPYLNLWGPYIFRATGQPYVHYPAPHLPVWTAAEQIREFLRPRAKRMPELLAFPHGSLDNPDWFSEPEAIAFEFLSYFVQGYRGAFGYYFPRGGDYRYWRALAEANTRIAENEELWRTGKEITSRVRIEPITPFPEKGYFRDIYAENSDIPPLLPGLHKKKLYQFRAFEHDGTIVAAIGNFWKRGELFFRFRLAGLDPRKSYTVSVPGAQRGVYTGAELARGIPLQAGALRWQFVSVKPAQSPLPSPARKAENEARFQRLLRDRLPAIRAAYKFEQNEYQKHLAAAARDARRNDFSGFKTLRSNEVELKGAGERLEVSAPHYRLQIDPGAGGRIIHFNAGKTALFGAPGKLGFGIDGFFHPVPAAKQLTGPYHFEGAEKTARGVRVRLSHEIRTKEIPLLAGMRVNKSYLFTPEGVELESTLKNHSENGMNFAFRFHFMPEYLGLNGNRSGTVRFADGAKFKREFFEKLYRFAPADAEIEKAFPMHKVFSITRPEALFSAPWSPVRLRGEMDPAELQCVVFWDDGKDPSATFEPIFKRRALAPGEEVRYRMKWSVETPEKKSR